MTLRHTYGEVASLDRRVLATAIKGHADVIVTFNLADLPAGTLARYGIEAQHPDLFRGSLLALDSAEVCAAAHRTGDTCDSPPDVAAYLTALAFMPLPGETGTEAREEDASTWLSKTVDTMAALLRTRGLTVSSMSTEGDPKHVLLHEAEQWGRAPVKLGALCRRSRRERIVSSSGRVDSAVSSGSCSGACRQRLPCGRTVR